jgi:selenocysteine-specific elongation factor
MSEAKRSIPFIIATAGHVDHGKSALVKALTKEDPDRLPEEKRRGITIDLGFAQWLLRDPENPSTQFDLGIVDVPGHEDFVKNMVSGVGAVDLGLLVVAADDGWMPQTEEHFQILEYLAVPNLIVVMTKSDLAEGEADFVMEMIREELKETRFEEAPIIATSTKTNEGFDALGNAVTDLLRSQPAHLDLGKPRLPIDRCFSVKGMGTVVTGTLIGAPFTTDQSVCVQPGNLQTKIRSIQHHHAQQESAAPGMRTALNLPGTTLRKGHEFTQTTVGRGQVVSVSNMGHNTECFDAVIERTTRFDKPGNPINGSIKSGTRIRVHLGSDNIPGRINFSDHKPMPPGSKTTARIRLERPMFAVEGDRFVLRDWSQQGTIGGGRIWDADSAHQKLSHPDQQSYLNHLSTSPGEAYDYLGARLAKDHGIQLEKFATKGQWTPKQLAREAAKLVKEKKVIKRSDWLLDTEWWNTSLKTMADRVILFHKTHPDKPGYKLEEARKDFGKILPAPELLSTVLSELAKEHAIEQAGECLCHQSHSVTLPDRLMPLADQIIKELSQTPNEPPARKHYDTSQDAGDTIRCLIRMNKVVEIGTDLLVLDSVYEDYLRKIKNHLSAQGPSTVSSLRQTLEVPRRIAIPLLEKLDKEGLTIREGDLRNWKPE